MKTARAFLFAFVVSAFISGSCARAGDAAPDSPNTPKDATATGAQSIGEGARVDLHTDRVVVFKDGYGLFVKTARGKADENGVLFTEEVPDNAVLGSFWAMWEGGTVSLRAEWVEHREEQVEDSIATSMLELLRANTGKKVTIGLRTPEQSTLEARIVRVLEEAPDPSKVVASEAGTTVEMVPTGGAFVLLEVDGGQLVFPVSDVRTLLTDSLQVDQAKREVTAQRRKRLVFDLGKKAAGDEVELTILYFRPGVRWIPTYRLEDGAKVADLSLQAEVLNEAESFAGAEIDLVVGVPNFRFKDVPSPLTLEATLRNALVQASPALMGSSNSLSNALYTQRSSEWNGSASSGAQPSIDPFKQVSGVTSSGHQDLFVYHAGKLSLDLGARATLPLWQQEAKKRNLYTFDIDTQRNGASGYSGNSYYSGRDPYGSPLALSANQVWRQIELDNTGDSPWTTGAVLILEGMLPLAQELLTYTPVKSRVLVPVTVAVDVRGGYEESESGRIPDALRHDGNDYMEVRTTGTATLTNFKDESVTVRVQVRAGGKAAKASDDAVIKVTDYDQGDWVGGYWNAVNTHSDVTWEVTLKAGETKTLTTEFSYYVR